MAWRSSRRLEVMPLTFLTVEAWTFLQLGARQKETSPAAPSTPVGGEVFLVAVGEPAGAGDLPGFLINLPIVSYYEIGTALTATTVTAMMGVYGMLAVGLAIFCLRYLVGRAVVDARPGWLLGLNIGLAWMSFVTLFHSASGNCTSPSTAATSARSSSTI